MDQGSYTAAAACFRLSSFLFLSSCWFGSFACFDIRACWQFCGWFGFEVAVPVCWQQGALIPHPRSFTSCPEPSPPTTGSVVCVSERSNITAVCECHLGYILSLSSWWLDFILSVESASKLASWADKSGHPLILWWLNSSAAALVLPGKRPLPGNSVWFFFFFFF